MAKENTTFSIDGEVKMNFKIECIRNEAEMSDTVEKMMLDYISLSQEIHKANKEARDEARQQR